MFRAIVSPILRSTRLCLQLVVKCSMMLPAGKLDEVDHPAYQPEASSVHYTTSYKHSLVLLRMGEIIARNMLSKLELIINRYCCI
jgi:hypothetical protein